MIPGKLITVFTFLLGGYCFAAPPVASIRSSGALSVNGIAVPANRVSWPVSVNDEIVTQEGVARIRFADGSTVTLQRNTRARLEAGSSRIEVKMLSGSAVYDVKKTSTVALTAPAFSGDAAAAAAPQGAGRQASANAFAYRMASRPASAGSGSAGFVIAPQAVSSGSFVPTGVDRDAIVETRGKSSIELPGHTSFEVTAQPDGSYKISKVVFKSVEDANGEITYITPKSSPLVGATINIEKVSLGSKAPRRITFSVTLPDATEPLTGSELAQELSKGATDALSETKDQLPPDSSVRQFNNPVTNGKFDGPVTVSPRGT